jgi:hypothetical protein
VLHLPPSKEAETARHGLQELVNCALAKSTWSKYASGINAFGKFEEHFAKRFTWPLDSKTIRLFVIWCVQTRHIQQSTIKGYLAAIRFVHQIRGFSTKHLEGDPLTDIILRGANRLNAMKEGPSNTRRVVTFPMLLTIGHRIAGRDWDPLSKQVIWTAATTAFFGSARLGELLASEEGAFSTSSDLTWSDVAITSQSSLLLRIKQPKTGSKEGKYIDLFFSSDMGAVP